MDGLLYLANPIYLSGVSFMICAAIVFFLRLLTKHMTGGRYGWDDLLLLLAILCFYTENAIQIYSIHLGKQVENGDDAGYSAYLQIVWISSAFAIPTLSLLKLSILVFYRSLFNHVRWFRLATNWLILVVVAFGVCGTAGEICEINDPAAPDTNPRTGCMDLETYARWAIALVIVDTILDAVILALPLVICCRLQLPLWKKASICAIFLLGGFTIATNIIRLVSMYSNRDTGRVGMINELWIVVHCGCAIICICLPLYGPLIAQAIAFLRRTWTSLRDRFLPVSHHSISGNAVAPGGWPLRPVRARPDVIIDRIHQDIGMSDFSSQSERRKISEKPSVDPFTEKAAQRVLDMV